MHAYIYVFMYIILNDRESYAGGSVATGSASNARQVKGDDPDKKRYLGPPGCGLGVELTTQPSKKCSVEKLLKLKLNDNFGRG
jgi:hypothetical protein